MVKIKKMINRLLEIERISPRDRHFFFGYYDKTPFNSENSKNSCAGMLITDRLPSAEDPVEIGFFEKNSTKWDWHGLEKVTLGIFNKVACCSGLQTMRSFLTRNETVIFLQR